MRPYQLTLEDFTKEFASLPDKYKLLLFKLQTAYCFKEAPLNDFEIAGIANVDVPLDENLIRFLKNYFVQTENGYWYSPAVDEQQKALNAQIEKEVQKRVARTVAGMKGGLKKAENQKTVEPSPDKPLQTQITNESPAESDQIPSNESANSYQSSSKPLASSYQTSSKVVANSWQNPSKDLANSYQSSSKTVANGWQNPSKELANSKQISSKPLAKAYQSSSKTVANGWQSNGKANAENEQPVDFQEKDENSPKVEAPENQASHVHASAPAPTRASVSVNKVVQPITDTDNFFINKNIKKNKSVSVSVSVNEKTENFKNQNLREKNENAKNEKFDFGKIWTDSEAKELFFRYGLEEKHLENWLARNEKNQNRFLKIVTEVLPKFNEEKFASLITRCKDVKDAEGAVFSGAVAYVMSSVEREKNFTPSAGTNLHSTPKSTKRPQPNYTEGLVMNSDGSWSPDPKYKPKAKRYSERDYTAGMIMNPDGSWSPDPNYRF